LIASVVVLSLWMALLAGAARRLARSAVEPP
jgi:hypothetical protein